MVEVKEGKVMRIDIKRALKEADLTYEDFLKKAKALDINISRTTLVNIANNNANPTLSKISDIAKVLECRVKDLFSEEITKANVKFTISAIKRDMDKISKLVE